MIIAERKFVVNASQHRLWEILLKAVLGSMPFERMQVKSEKKVQALLKAKAWFISLPMDVEIEIMNISPPDLLVSTLKGKGMKGIVWLRQRSNFMLKQISEEQTEVSCTVEDDGMAIILKLFMSGQVKAFTAEAFDKIEKLLQQWA